MPIKKSACKELRKGKKRHLRNINMLSELKTLNKNFLNLVSKKKIEEAQKLLKKISSKLDTAAGKKMIHRNQASRKKSRLARKLKKS